VVYGFAFGLWLNLRSGGGGATRGKWRVSEGMGECGLFFCTEL
jgi:hypothetical protein